MNDGEFVTKLKNAVEVATKKQIEINRRDRDETGDESYEYEANFKATLYHELLIQGGFYYADVRVESKLDTGNSRTSSYRYDLVVDLDEAETQYAIEVKLVKRLKGLREWISKEESDSRDGTVFRDLKKLSDANLDAGNEFYKTKGVMIISYCGTESTSPDNEQMIEDNIKQGLNAICRKIESKDIKLIYTAGKSCIMRGIDEIV
jgi:hypothetical protein